MTDEKLNNLLADAFEEEIKVPTTVLYKVRVVASKKAQQKENRKEYSPFLLVFIMHTVLVLMGGIGIILLVQIPNLITGIVIGMVMLINLPIVTYMLVKTYYKDQEANKSLQKEV